MDFLSLVLGLCIAFVLSNAYFKGLRRKRVLKISRAEVISLLEEYYDAEMEKYLVSEGLVKDKHYGMMMGYTSALTLLKAGGAE
jgi:hypothetical protein